MSDPDTEGWTLGPKLHALGSIHSDVWRGAGGGLAQKAHIAVYPVSS
jgi:hypothetical protein